MVFTRKTSAKKSSRPNSSKNSAKIVSSSSSSSSKPRPRKVTLNKKGVKKVTASPKPSTSKPAKKPAVKQAKRVSSRQISSASEDEDGSEAEISIELPTKPTFKRTSKSAPSVKSPAKPISPVKKQGGRPKRLAPVPITAIPLRKKEANRTSAVQDIRYRSVVTHSSKLIRLAQSVFEKVAEENGGAIPEAVVVEKSIYNPRSMHRKRISWTAGEEEDLEVGVESHGEGHWSAILSDSNLRFHASRTQVDLKDKWRNMKHYKPYNQISTRRFILVDSRHQPILSAAGQPHIYNNKWPRDAAAKAATKDQFYQVDHQTGERPQSILIFLRELIDEEVQRESVDAAARAAIVHVYRGTRTLEPPPANVARFAHYDGLWRADVEKVACEQLLTADLLKTTQFVNAEEQARDRGYL